MTDRRLTVCLFGIFNPGYSRSRMVRLGLERAGWRVIVAQDRTPGWRKYRELIRKHRAVRGQYDVLLVCFPGQTAMVLARFLTRKPILFDAFTSLYDSDVYDRAVVRPYGPGALWRFLLDFISMHLADFVLVDTEAQHEYYQQVFRLRAERIGVLPVGSVETIMRPAAAPTALQASGRGAARERAFVVHFHGHYIPLQGVGVVLGAARELIHEGVQFAIIGRGQQYDEIRQLAERWQLTNVRFVESVPYEQLPERMAEADVCLGIFGATAKGARVVPNKAFEAIACAKPLITQDSPASREVFTDGVNALLVPASDPAALAAAILRLRDDPALRARIARAGHELFLREFTVARIGERLASIIQNSKFKIQNDPEQIASQCNGAGSSKFKKTLFFILIGAFALRVIGISYGLPYRLVGDEESFIGGGLKLLELNAFIPAFAGAAFEPYYLPPVMYYLSLIVFAPVLALQYLVSGAQSISEFRLFLALDPSWVWLSARALSAVLGTATVWFVYAAGRDFVSRRAGVAAAALVAASFLAASISHFARHWVPALLAVSLVLWASGRIVAMRRAGAPEERVRRWYWLTGLLAGLGFGVSYVPVLALAFVFGVHAFIGRMSLRSRVLWEAAGIAVFVAVVMVALHPFAFFRIIAGDAGSVVEPKTIVGFFGAFGYFGEVLWAYDPVLFAVGLVGFGYLLIASRRLAAVFVAFAFIYVAALYLSFHHEVRYALLMVPVLAIAGGALVDRLMAAAPRVTAGVFAVFLLSAAAVVVRLDTLLLRPDTRVLAKAAVEATVPAGTGVATTLREVRLTPTRESLEFQAMLDPASLRSFDRALLSPPEASWSQSRPAGPQPRYNLINLHFVSAEKLPADPVAFLRERGVRVVVMQYWNPADLTPAAERIRSSTALTVRFANLPGGRSRDFLGNDLAPIWDIFSADRLGPIVELRKLE